MTARYSKEADLKRVEEHLLNADSKPWRWLFYGDSVTHGAAHTIGWRAFPEIFAERLRWEIQFEENHHPMALDCVINNAYSGWTTADLLEHYPEQVRAFCPDFVSVMVGMNDTVRPGIPAEYETNLRKLVELIRADGAVAVLHTMNRLIPSDETNQNRFDRMDTYVGIIRKIAAEMDVILVDNYAVWPTFESDKAELERWLGESIHPGGRGHLEIARLLAKELGMYSEKSACLHPQGMETMTSLADC